MTTPIEPFAESVEADFRSLMSGFPTGVAVITAFGPDGRPWGMTCSSMCSVCLAPPTLLICLRQGSPTLDAVEQRTAFAANVLHSAGQPTAQLFASGAPDRFDRVRWEAAPETAGPHLFDDAHSVADCKVTRTQEVGDHTVVFGQVLRVTSHTSDPQPLLYGLRRYVTWTQGQEGISTR
jgi:flavin reductase (NADH)